MLIGGATLSGKKGKRSRKSSLGHFSQESDSGVAFPDLAYLPWDQPTWDKTEDERGRGKSGVKKGFRSTLSSQSHWEGDGATHANCSRGGKGGGGSLENGRLRKTSLNSSVRFCCREVGSKLQRIRSTLWLRKKRRLWQLEEKE